MKNKPVILISLLAAAAFGVYVFSNSIKMKGTPTDPTVNTEVYLGQQPNPEDKSNKLCGWVDASDIVIKLNFAEGVTKDTSYEAGFAFSSISRTARLARNGCDYRTGFSFEEMKNKGAVQVAVWGYTDSRRRQLENEPVSVIFDEGGKPNIPLPIEVTVLD